MIGKWLCTATLFRIALISLCVAQSSFAVEPDYGATSEAAAPAIVCTAPNKAVSDYFDLISRTRQQNPKLVEALRQFPKGADIHNHLSGAVMPEEYFGMAKADGDCYGPDRTSPNMYTTAAADPTGACNVDFKPFTAATQADRLKILQSLSMYHYTYPDIQHGHDQFFATFGRFGAVSGMPWSTGPMLAMLLRQARIDQVSHVETMLSFQSQALNTLTGQLRNRFPDDSFYRNSANYPALYDFLLGTGLNDAVAGAQNDISQYVNKTNAILKCGSADKEQACDVSYAFLAAVNRNAALKDGSPDLAKIFVQTAFSMLLASTDSRVTGVNLLSGEDSAVSMQSFATQMRFFTFFHTLLPDANIALHAGELTPCFVGEGNRALKEHLTGSLKAGAKRIGHGVSFAYLNNADKAEVAGLMKGNNALVEIMFTSNAQILGVAGDDHPFMQYRAHGVPTAFSTDDEGVSHADYTSEWVYGFMKYGLGVDDLTRLARESLQHSFIKGASLWDDLATEKVVSQCAGIKPGTPNPPDPCKSFLNANAKATAQWGYEGRLSSFLQSKGNRLALSRKK